MSATLIVGLYVACELIANVTASTPIILSEGFAVPGGVFIYALTFTLLDLANERLGKQGAKRMVYAAFAANVLLAGYVHLVSVLARNPNLSWNGVPPALVAAPRIVAASLAAYLVASLVDVQIFAWWRERVRGPSNSVSTLIDSVVFIGIAFGLVVSRAEVSIIPALIVGQYAVKMGITAISLPLIYTIRGGTSGQIGREEPLPQVSRKSVWAEGGQADD
jgi:uncharacterized integral membrane protein (TIGR00697 family)